VAADGVRAGSVNVLWMWNNNTRQLRSGLSGPCIDDKGGAASVHLWSCDVANPNQWWVWDPVAKHLRSNRGKCLSAGSVSVEGAPVDLATCHPTQLSQQWLAGSPAPAAGSAPSPAVSYTICDVAEQVGESKLRMVALDDDASCDADFKVGPNPWIEAENPPIHFSAPDPATVELFAAGELVLEPVWSPNPDIAGR
jgi:hypothetical protein